MTRRFQGWTIPDDSPSPLSRADIPFLLLILPLAGFVVGAGAFFIAWVLTA